MKHIVLFSGGAASSYMADLVAKEHKNEEVILLHTPTYAEHPDADRFREQVSRRIGIPMTIQADGRSLWELIDDEHCLPSDRIPFCSRILKQEQTDKFIETLDDDFILYYGYGIFEGGRVQKQYARFEARKIKAEYPIHKRLIQDETIKRTIKSEWKICLPEPYLYLQHNNCIPCFLGGKRHFYMVWKHYPTNFKMAIEKEHKTGHTTFKDVSLDELEEKWKNGGQIEFDLEDTRPCMCAF